MRDADHLMRQAVADNVFPGGVLLVSKEREIIFFEAYGFANIFTKREIRKDTIFDLASLTKPLATTLAIMKLFQEFVLDIEQSVGSLIPQFRDTEKADIRVRDFLAHCSGLPDHRPYYGRLCKVSPDRRKGLLRKLLVAEPLICPTGEQVIYSDLGFMILEWLVEQISGQRLDHFIHENIYQPLGLENLFFVDTRLGPVPGDFAATECCPWRKMLLEGLVHDDNAYAAGGIGGHAGLFGTACDVHTLLSTLLGAVHGYFSACIFQKNTLKMFFERQRGSERTLGFDSPSLRHSSCGHHFSRRTVGHLGFTGTSFWMDLDRSVIVILLTNRVHPSRNNMKIRVFRPELHDAVMRRI